MGTTIIILALILFLFWPVIKLGFRIYRAQSQMRKTFRQATSQQRREQQQQAEREKIFDRNVGEYVDFEEIDNNSHDSSQQYNPPAKVEPQIEDAEWEDIK